MESPPPAAGTDAIVSAAPARLVSIDALRGFIMFWIVGGDAFIGALGKAWHGSFPRLLSTQMSHSAWEGVTFYDLIFPSFIFIVGVSLVFSCSRSLARVGRAETVRRVLRRSLLLYLLGVFAYNGLAGGWDHIRWLGVLQRIALCYLVSATAFSLCRPRTLVALCALLLLGYWAAMTFIPIREISLERQHLRQAFAEAGHTDVAQLYEETTTRVTGRFEDGLNVANHADFLYLPGKKWDGAYDPEGLLSTIPAIATCLLGVFAGLLLRDGQMPEQRKVLILIAAGVAGILLGELWGLQFPVIKKIWTSSYVLVAGGWSCLLLALFHQAIDLQGWRRWCVPFVWYGMNSITIYVVHLLVDFRQMAERLVGGPVKETLGPWGNPLISAVALLFATWFVRELYRRQVFLKL